MGEIDRVLDDVALVLEIGGDVDGCVGDEQRPRIGRHVHEIDVAESAAGAQTALRSQHRMQQFVGMQRAFHQERGLARLHQSHGRGRGRLAMRRIDEPVTARYRPSPLARRCGSSLCGPTRIGAIRPACAASTAAPSALASQG